MRATVSLASTSCGTLSACHPVVKNASAARAAGSSFTPRAHCSTRAR